MRRSQPANQGAFGAGSKSFSHSMGTHCTTPSSYVWEKIIPSPNIGGGLASSPKSHPQYPPTG